MPTKPPTPAENRSGVIALFDFDGTVTVCDSLMPFLRMAVGRVRFWTGLVILIPALLSYGLGRIDRARLKEIMLGHYIGGWETDRFQDAIEHYTKTALTALCNGEAIARISWHRAQGHRVILISASPEAYLTPWAANHHIETVLATRLEILDGTISGRIHGRNCRGVEKIERLSEYLQGLDGYEFHAYGDSVGDRELLALATHAHYRPFRHFGAGIMFRLRFLKAIL